MAVKVSVSLDEEVHSRLKKMAVQECTSMTELLQRALKSCLGVTQTGDKLHPFSPKELRRYHGILSRISSSEDPVLTTVCRAVCGMLDLALRYMNQD